MGVRAEIIDIRSIAAGGAGVGRLADGRVTFAHRTAPGDRVEVEVFEQKPRWTRSRLLRLIEAGPGRREPPCPHYAHCGGCTLEHLEYDAQRAAKSRIVGDALRRIARIDTADPEVVSSPEEFRYRNRVTFTLRRGSSGVVAGFHALEQPDRLVDVTGACLLPEAPIGRAWTALRSCWGPQANRLPSGEELRVTLRATADGAVSLAVDGGYAAGRPEELLEAVEGLQSIWHRTRGRGAYLLLAGADTMVDLWADEDVELSGDVFTQVNRGAAALLAEHVLDRVAATGPRRVLDAYCGVGSRLRRLEGMGLEVIGIEAHPDAVVEARRVAPASRVLAGRVEDRIDEAFPVDAAVVNPPRAGLHRRVSERLRAVPPGTLLYVSCDPATLARDLTRLGPDWRVDGVRCFDLFPQTAHVETVVEMRCATS